MAGKKGKKGKKGKRKEKKSGKEPHMTPQEAILAYQINVVEKKLEDVSYEIRGWEEKNGRNLARNEKLKHEQGLLLQQLLKSQREVGAGTQSQESQATREDVTQEMLLKWQRQREREKEIERLKNELLAKESEVSQAVRDLNWWRIFRDSGQHQQQMHIKLLEQEIRDIETSFVEMEAHLVREKEGSISEMENLTQEALSQQKDLAAQRAMSMLEKTDRQEVIDNDWLRKEVALHRLETNKASEVVARLEQENLHLMAQLFECSVEDLKVSRSCYLTQLDDTENLEHSGILELDLAKINVTSDDDIEEQVRKPLRGRPQSATQKAIEEKVFSLIAATDSEDETSETESGIYENYYFEEENFDDYLKLGPLELKLLSITGLPAPIHTTPAQSQEETEAKLYKPDQWPVTVAMLKGPLVPV